MPSPIGHALGGVIVAWSAERIPSGPAAGRAPEHVSAALTLACAALAAAPDLDLLLPGWHRTVTHSVGAVIIVTIISACVTGWVTGKINWRIAGICGVAYASHLLLDWLGADPSPPLGIQALWPFSHRWFIARWTIFPITERRNFFSWASFATNVKAAAVEVIVLGPVVLGLWRMRATKTRRAKKAGQA